MRTYSRKTNRKTPKLKLNTSGVISGARPEIRYEHLDWSAVEKEYVALPEREREEIHAAANHYLWQDHSEAKAPLLEHALAEIVQIAKQASLLAELMAQSNNEGARYAKYVVDHQFQMIVGHPFDFAALLRAYQAACASARTTTAELSNTSGFKEGQAWRSFVWQLMDIAEHAGLPATVGKPNTQREYRLPPFARLVRELQKQLPKGCWPTPSSDSALAAAISAVRSQRTRRLALGGNYPRNSEI